MLLVAAQSKFDIAEIILLNNLSLGNNLIDLSLNDNIIFKRAFTTGNIHLIKWLFKMKPSIDIFSIDNYECADNSSVFYIGVTNWINLHNDKYNITIVNNIIKCKLKITNGYEYVDNIETCVICMDIPCDIITNCNHQFCMDCIIKWNKKSKEKSCPTCRKNENLDFYEIKFIQ